MENGKNYFRSLAPDNNAENVGSYAAWLHSVATDSSTNQDYGNIALTGDIGIGKSSIVRTYEKNKNYKFVYITAGDLGYRFEKDEITGLPLLSLKKEKANDNSADEQEENSADGQAESEKSAEKSDEAEQDEIEKLSEEIQQKLEKNLLEQLIALCSSKDIPKSRFQTVPENESTADKRFWQIIYPIFCAIAAFCGFKLIANNFIEKDYIDFIDFVPIMWLILIIFFSLSIGVAVSKLITHYKFTKITLNVGKEDNGGASAEIDIDEGENASLDTNLHEIIYLFEQLADKKSGKNEKRPPVFVIEDVDCYPAEICFPILTKFKQINDMLNSRYRLNHSGYGKHFKFIYTLNDKIFDDSQGGRSISDNDPYKFFDVIIPVIPKLSFANSYNELDEFFNVDNQYFIDPIFLQKISPYIYDFRKLRDIENEFVVYRNKFDSNLPSKALLAFVMYKIFYKSKYYELFKTDKKGVPQSKLLQKVLYGSKEIVTDGELEEILVSRFDAWLGTILNMSDFVKKSYLEKMVTSGEKKDWSGRDLSELNLNKSDLQGYFFRNTILKKTYLEHAHLEYARLEHAHLESAHLMDAHLEHAHLRDAHFEGADLEGAHLKRARLYGTHLEGAYLEEANLEDAYLGGANLEEANLLEANLERAILCGTNLKNVIYDKTTIWTGAKYDFRTKFPDGFKPKEHGMILDLMFEDLGNMDLSGKDLSNALLLGANLENVIYDFRTKFPDGFKPKEHGMILDLRYEDLRNMDLSGKDLSNALLHGANLEKVIYDKTKWEGAKYDSNTKFPDDFKPEEHGMELI